jgi:FtsH Extracellular
VRVWVGQARADGAEFALSGGDKLNEIDMNQTVKAVIFWAVIMVSAFVLWQVVRSGGPAQQAVPEISYSEFLERVENGQVSRVTVKGSAVQGSAATGDSFLVTAPPDQTAMLDTLKKHKVEIGFKTTQEQGWPSWILNLAPLFFSPLCGFSLIRQMQRRRSAEIEPSSATPLGNPRPALARDFCYALLSSGFLQKRLELSRQAFSVEFPSPASNVPRGGLLFWTGKALRSEEL